MLKGSELQGSHPSRSHWSDGDIFSLLLLLFLHISRQRTISSNIPKPQPLCLLLLESSGFGVRPTWGPGLAVPGTRSVTPNT